MATNPKSWRTAQGLSLADLAKKAGISGNNPARTYDRYERGEQACPAEVVEVVKTTSGGAVNAESWHGVRLAHLRAVDGSEKARRA
jgi:transcriptional regulator with XRE-family HTH domain